jgi:hypothetical protein
VWAGPDAAGDGGTFSTSEAASWAGPGADADGGTFVSAEAALWAGPDATGEGGTFGVLETAAWAGPDASGDGGTFAVNEGAVWAGPDADADGGTFTSTVLTIANWAGPEADAGGGTFTATELASWAGPDSDADGGTFGVGEAASWSGPDATADGGTFTYLTTITRNWAGPDATGAAGTFTFAKTDEYFVGTQYIEGALDFTGATTINLRGSVFAVAGDYVLFDYTAGSFPDGQTDLNTHVTIANVDLPASVALPASSGVTVLEDQPGRKLVVLHLNSAPTNGKQYVEGDLVFSGATTVQLAEGTYVTKGTYELFEVTGTVTGLGNLTCVSSRGYTCTVSQVGNIIYVTLA